MSRPTDLIPVPQTYVALRGTLVDPVEAALAGVVSDATLVVYERDLRVFVSDLYDLLGIEPQQATVDDLLHWWQWMRRQPTATGTAPKPATVNRKVASVRRLYKAMYLRSIIDRNVADILANLKIDRMPQGRALTQEETNVLLEVASPCGTLINLRDRLVLHFLVLTGCRTTELCKAQVSDLRTTGGRRMVRVIRKGGKEDNVALPGELPLLMDSWLHRTDIVEGPIIRGFARSPDGAVIRSGSLGRRSIHMIVKTRAEQAGLGDDVGPHDLRKTWVTAALDMGVPIHTVARGAGHASVDTTNRYNIQREFMQNNPGDAVARWLKGEKA